MAGAIGISILVGALVAFASIVSYGIAWYSWRYAEHPVSNRFALVLAADGAWAMFFFFQMVSPTDAIATAWLLPESTVVTLSAALWFFFIIEYTGDSDWIPDIVEPIVVGHAFVYGALYALNPSGIVIEKVTVSQFGLVRLPVETWGPISTVEVGIVYALLIASYVLLGWFYLQTRNLYRKQTGVILAVSVAVVIANVVYVAGLAPHPDLDLTTVFFIVQALGVGLALYQYDFLTITPLAANRLIEEMPDPVFVLNMDGKVLDYNDAAATFLPADGRQHTAADVDIDGFERVLETPDGGSDTNVLTATRNENRVATYDSTTTLIRDQYGEVQGTVVVLRDISAREANKRALEAQNRRLEEFASIVSHDLRNPLQVVDGRIDLARTSGNLDHLDAAEASVDRIERLIDDLLALAKEGNTIDELTAVDLASLSCQAWDTVDTREGTLVVDADLAIAADRNRLQQVFENLFGNAIEHGGTDVSITVGELPDGFYVADDGPGIPEDERETVFELGYTTATDGTGLGLAIVERIVEAHGWSIHATENEDGGARFEVTGITPLDRRHAPNVPDQ